MALVTCDTDLFAVDVAVEKCQALLFLQRCQLFFDLHIGDGRGRIPGIQKVPAAAVAFLEYGYPGDVMRRFFDLLQFGVIKSAERAAFVIGNFRTTPVVDDIGIFNPIQVAHFTDHKTGVQI